MKAMEAAGIIGKIIVGAAVVFIAAVVAWVVWWWYDQHVRSAELRSEATDSVTITADGGRLLVTNRARYYPVRCEFVSDKGKGHVNLKARTDRKDAGPATWARETKCEWLP
jgi:hypothetical protein